MKILTRKLVHRIDVLPICHYIRKCWGDFRKLHFCIRVELNIQYSCRQSNHRSRHIHWEPNTVHGRNPCSRLNTEKFLSLLGSQNYISFLTDVAVSSVPPIVAVTFQCICAISVITTWQGDASVTMSSFPSDFTSAKVGSTAFAVLTFWIANGN